MSDMNSLLSFGRDRCLAMPAQSMTIVCAGRPTEPKGLKKSSKNDWMRRSAGHNAAGRAGAWARSSEVVTALDS